MTWQITLRDSNGDRYILPFDSYATADQFMNTIRSTQGAEGVAWVDIKAPEEWTLLNVANIVSTTMEQS